MQLPSEALARVRRELESTGEEAVVLAGEAYFDPLDDAIERGRDEEIYADGPVKGSLVGRWIASMMEPPPGLPIRSRIGLSDHRRP